MRFYIFLTLFGLAIGSFSQQLSWQLSVDGSGNSNHQELNCIDFTAGSGVTSFTFGSTGAYAKSWGPAGLDNNKYFQVGFTSVALDTFQLDNIQYSERRSGTGIRTYELRYSTQADFSTYTSLGIVNVPDNDSERDTSLQNLQLQIMPQSSFYLRWYGYSAESSAGSWRINDGSLKMYLSTYVPDVTPPELDYAEVLDATSIQMNFDDMLDSNSYQLSDFTLDDAINPEHIDNSQVNQGVIILHFANDFPFAQIMNLKYRNITDTDGNTMDGEQNIQLVYYTPEPFSLIIDEIMADPSPSVYLPENEYFEIYNSKNFPMSLRGWRLKNGSSTYDFPVGEIAANSYVLVVPNGKANLYDESINTIEMDFGTIGNSSASLSLISPQGNWIQQVNYNSDWHTESYKKSGGWSVEMIDLSQPCNMDNNWESSVSTLGGTPGAINSVYGQVVINSNIDISHAYFSDSNKVILQLNKMLSPDYSPNALSFTINQDHPYEIQYPVGTQEISMSFVNNFDTNIVYQLQITDTLRSCNSSYLPIPKEMQLGLPLLVDSNDIVINEILFNPKSSGEKYIEFYNQSNKILDLKELKLGLWDEGVIVKKDFLSDIPLVVFPQEYFVLTKNRDAVMDNRAVTNPNHIFNTNQFLSLSTTKDRIYLLNKGDQIVDEVYYDEAYQNPSLSTFDGVALEKTNPDDVGLCPQSWHSASEESGFGTPTSVNSLAVVNPDNIELTIANAYFNDSLSLTVRFNKLLSVDFVPNKENFTIDEQQPDSVIYVAGHDNIRLYFSNSFQENVSYNLEITDSIGTCAGDNLEIPTFFRMGIPLKVDSNDIVINELFFNPEGSNKTFIECYNQSNKIIDLSEIKLGILNGDDITPKSVLFSEPTVVFPKDYFVLTKDKANILEQFYVKNPLRLYQTEEMVTLSSTEDYVFVLDKGNKQIDEAYYSEDFHNPILSKKEGVSLEKINPSASGLNSSVWQSASQNSGFGTPTYVNSQYSESGEQGSDIISFDSETFSPDMDGYHDFLIINYNLKQSGYSASVKIYNSKGQFILDLITNEFTGKHGQWTWDGRDAAGKSSPLGIYVVVFEFIHANGDMIQQKKVCTIAGKL